MAVYVFQIMSPRGTEPFHHSQIEELDAALKQRGVTLTGLAFDGYVSEEDLRRGRGYVAGVVPVAVLVSVTVNGPSCEDVRAALQLAASDVGRGDVEVVNA